MEKITIRQTKRHLLTHNVGDYQCLYCLFAGNTLMEITGHMADSHSNQLMIIANRFYRNSNEVEVKQKFNF